MSPSNGERERAAALDAVRLDLSVAPDRGEVARYLGYPADARPDPRVLAEIDAAMAAAWPRLRPRGIYAIHEVEALDRRSLTLRGGARFAGAIGNYLGLARRAAVFVVTAGAEIGEMWGEAIAAGDTLGGFIYGAIGSMAAEGTADALLADLREHLDPGEALTLRYSPGYCGLTLAQQRTIFGLVDAATIEVELLPSLIMTPLKSVSGIVGIGPAEALAAQGSPCNRCGLTDCKMRR
jgi:hypothetical protein